MSLLDRIRDFAVKVDKQYNKHKVAIEAIVTATDYLQKYGYINFDDGFTIDEFRAGVIRFQSFFGLTESGELDFSAIKLISNPFRCGVPDIMPLRTEEARWRKNRLTYFIKSFVGDQLSQTEQRQAIALGFKQWSDIANLGFTEVQSTQADIIIDSARGQQAGFDGKSGTLAYAYLPNGSDKQLKMYYDLDEHWIKQTDNIQGVRFLNVSCHEFGHLLGLEHSKVQSALMAPYYSFNISKPQQNDDVTRIQALYGKPTVVIPPPDNPPPTTPPDDSSVTAILITGKVDKISIDGYRVQKL